MKEKNSVWYQHEALDRTHMLLVMLQESLGFHDSDGDFEDVDIHPGVWNQECKELLSKVSCTLAELYQKIGEWEEEQ